MPTTVTSVPVAWTLIQNGPLASSAPAAIQAFSGNIIYTLVGSLPAAEDEGHLLPSGAGHTISLVTGENLYARSASDTTAKMAVTV